MASKMSGKKWSVLDWVLSRNEANLASEACVYKCAALIRVY